MTLIFSSQILVLSTYIMIQAMSLKPMRICLKRLKRKNFFFKNCATLIVMAQGDGGVSLFWLAHN